MKTPEDIKSGMKRCMQGHQCKAESILCPYYVQCLKGIGKKRMLADALAYIKQLEEAVSKEC